MSGIWTPSTSKEVNELTVKIESTTFEIRKIENKVDGAKQQLEHVKGYHASMLEAIVNLRSPESRIVSLPEYQTILSDIGRAEIVINDCEAFIATQHNQITLMKKDISLMKERLDALESYSATILEFKRRGTRS
jgi:chromosome segregation ATPase